MNASGRREPPLLRGFALRNACRNTFCFAYSACGIPLRRNTYLRIHASRFLVSVTRTRHSCYSLSYYHLRYYVVTFKLWLQLRISASRRGYDIRNALAGISLTRNVIRQRGHYRHYYRHCVMTVVHISFDSLIRTPRFISYSSVAHIAQHLRNIGRDSSRVHVRALRNYSSPF